MALDSWSFAGKGGGLGVRGGTRLLGHPTICILLVVFVPVRPGPFGPVGFAALVVSRCGVRVGTTPCLPGLSFLGMSELLSSAFSIALAAVV